MNPDEELKDARERLHKMIDYMGECLKQGKPCYPARSIGQTLRRQRERQFKRSNT